MDCFILQQESSSQGQYPAANYLSLSAKQTDFSDTYSYHLNSFSSSVSSPATADSLTIDTAESRVDPASATSQISGDTALQSVPEIVGDEDGAAAWHHLIDFLKRSTESNGMQSEMILQNGDLHSSARKSIPNFTDGDLERKKMSRWTDQVKVCSEGLELPHDDGYSWRKYGQEDILGANLRYAYMNTQNCWATKQVQRSDEDPTIFEVTYRGLHACAHGQQVVPPPASLEEQEQKQAQAQAQAQATVSSFQKGLQVKEMKYPLSFAPTTTYGDVKSACSYSPSFISPTTPEPDYFSVSPFQVNNSPIIDPDFALKALELDPNFPFDTVGFFSLLH